MLAPMASFRNEDMSEYPTTVMLSPNAMFLHVNLPSHFVEVMLPHESKHEYSVVLTPYAGNVKLAGEGGTIADAIRNAWPYCKCCFAAITDGSGECPKCGSRQGTINNETPRATGPSVPACPKCGERNARIRHTNYGDFDCNECRTHYDAFGKVAVKHDAECLPGM